MPEGTSLTPVAFLERAARVFRDKVAVVDGSRRLTYGEFADRARRLAGLLASPSPCAARSPHADHRGNASR
jgi:non-ribosomal peptide synthetase component E (peptide arylation enzyme)